MTRTRHSGFTLVELLVAISLMATLAAAATVAVMRVKGSEQVRASEATLSKLKSGLDRRWKAMLDDARDDLGASKQACRLPEPAKSRLYDFAGDDHERAKVIWTYCKLRNEFPTNIMEACNHTLLPDPANLNTAAPYLPVLPPKVAFTAAFKTDPVWSGSWVGSPTSPLDGDRIKRQLLHESAACLYVALTATATRGETFGGDGTANQTGPLPYSITVSGPGAAPVGNFALDPPVFKDAFGNPIAFLRLAYAPELNAAPYTRGAAGGNRDPLDPLGKLTTPGPPGTLWDAAKLPKLLEAFWGVAADGHTTLDANPFWRGRNGTPWHPYYPRDVVDPPRGAWNWSPTLVSAGADGVYEPDLGKGDDLLSFRLAWEGNRGN